MDALRNDYNNQNVMCMLVLEYEIYQESNDSVSFEGFMNYMDSVYYRNIYYKKAIE